MKTKSPYAFGLALLLSFLIAIPADVWAAPQAGGAGAAPALIATSRRISEPTARSAGRPRSPDRAGPWERPHHAAPTRRGGAARGWRGGAARGGAVVNLDDFPGLEPRKVVKIRP